MQNKPKVKYAKINVSSFITNKYEQMDILVIQTNKPKTNPIQTQFKPKQTQLKPIQTQTKPKQSQFQRLKMNTFARVRNVTIIYCDLLAAFTTLTECRTLEFSPNTEYYLQRASHSSEIIERGN
jgi:hypothetical protein